MKEHWVTLKFDFEHENDLCVEISDLGNIRTSSKMHKNRLLKGTMINGYKSVCFRFSKPANKVEKGRIEYLRGQLKTLTMALMRAKNSMAKNGSTFSAQEYNSLAEQIMKTEELHSKLKSNYQRELKKFNKRRAIYFSSLQHRLVAEQFCKKPSEKHNIVIHLNYNKTDNRAENLKWVTMEESIAHAQKSPFVIEEKKQRKEKGLEKPRHSKLNPSTVAIIKKRINEGKMLSHLAKQFDITHTQLLRIKRGINWAHVKPAA